MRLSKHFSISAHDHFKDHLFDWASQDEVCFILDGQQMAPQFKKFDAIVAVGCQSYVKLNSADALSNLDQFTVSKQDWIFYTLAYDLKNRFESLSSTNHDLLNFPEALAIQPLKVICISGQEVEFHYPINRQAEIDLDYANILNSISQLSEQESTLKFKARLSKEEYIKRVEALKAHIQRGDIYEINFCQEFYCTPSHFESYQAFKHLNSRSKAPFSAFVKFDDYHVVSASPERYISKIGSQLFSQPIKGTARRGKTIPEDQSLINHLKSDPKERAENVMIVDLVRNDLSKIAQKASVTVDELCEVYTFNQVHQMISTISCQLKPNLSLTDILKATFPMGSMTGAPKVKAMKLAEDYETTKRGLYSGCIGYQTPQGDFDFNVVIRTLLYNSSRNYLSYMVGSAITNLSRPELEYDECLLKGKALQTVFERLENRV